jgi:3-dehydroquinate dehydratase/shikimate dehydrogenase
MSRPLLCATVFASDLRSALARAAAAPPEADLIEFRLDALRDPDPERLVRESPRPVILTCRPRRQGGAFAGDETERLQLLARGIAAGAAYVDVELDAAAALGDRGGARLIVSWHDLAGTPADLAGLLARIRSHSPDVAKIVTTATGPEDVLRLLDLLSRPGPPLAAHPMGRAGLAGRVLAARAGSAIVYGAADSRGPGAPGQPALRTLIDDYRLDRDLAGIPSLLLLGGRLGHSVSPRMMNRTFAARELPALYVPFEVDDPEPVLRGLARLAAVGAAVTIPLKERVAGLVDDLDPVAARLGAVNTVVREGARLAGGNTDVGGAMDAIRAVRPDLAGCRAVVLGAGGAARAIGGGLVWAGARVVFVNRTRERARRLAEMLGATESALDAVDPASVDLLVNATPVGQWPRAGECPVPESFPRAGQVVMDAVYNPGVRR